MEKQIPGGACTGEFMTMEDWMPTLMSWVGQKTIKEELLTGKEIAGKNYRSISTATIKVTYF